MADIESLELRITGDSKDAKAGLDALITTLDTLKTKVGAGAGLTSLANQVGKLATSAGKLNGSEGAKLESLAKGLSALSNLGSLKLSPSVANQISAMGAAVKNLDGVDYSKLSGIATAVQPLISLGKSNLGSVLGQIKKLPEVMVELGKVDMAAFTAKIKELTASLKPLANEMQKVASGFSVFPDRIQKFISSSSKIPSTNATSAKSFANLAARITATFYVFKRGARIIASWITQSNAYTENLNLFTVAMGEYADSAMKYANTVSEAMGIDTSDWIRSQGVFMTLATGFGVAGDRAAIMSQQLTQLGYDLSSFFNISVEESMQKLKSGFAGELEPLRNLGYDLSQAKLEAIALSLGIDKSVSSMTQAEKAQLRYYAIMTQVTQAQGDMARTLQDPANQLRVLKAQLQMATRALGDLFIPALNAVLPYAIAVVKVIRLLANTIASLFGGGKSEAGESGLEKLEISAGGASEAIEEATGNAAKLRKTLLGIDELNVMSDPSSGGAGGGVGAGGGFDFELPTYDFLSEAAVNRVNEIVEKMKEWLGLTEDIDSWADLMDTKLGTILKTVGAIGLAFGAWKIGAGIVSLVSVLGTNLSSMTTALNGISTAIGAISTPALIVAAAIAAVIAGLVAVYVTNEDVRKSVNQSVQDIGTSLQPLLQFFTDTILPDLKNAWDELIIVLTPFGVWLSTVFTSIWEGRIIPFLEYMSATVIPTVTGTLENLWNNIFVPLGTFLASVFAPIVEKVSTVLTWLWQYVCIPLGDLLGGTLSAVFEGLARILNQTVIPIVNVVISVFQFLWTYVLSPITNFLWSTFSPAFESIFISIGDIMGGIKQIFGGLITFITGVFTLDWRLAWSGIVELFTGIWTVISTYIATPINASLKLVEGFINSIISGWNALKRQINKLSISIPAWLGGGTLGFNLQMSSMISIPRLAEGGIVDAGQMFVAREAGPELVGSIGNRSAVVNNDQIVDSVSQGVYSAVVHAMAESGSNQVVEAKVNDKVLFEVIVGRNRQETMRTGRSPLLGGV